MRASPTPRYDHGPKNNEKTNLEKLGAAAAETAAALVGVVRIA